MRNSTPKIIMAIVRIVWRLPNIIKFCAFEWDGRALSICALNTSRRPLFDVLFEFCVNSEKRMNLKQSLDIE